MRLIDKTVTTKRAIFRFILRIIQLFLPAAAAVGIYLLPQYAVNTEVADFYSSKVFPIIALIPNSLSNIFMISLTEVLVFVGIPIGIILIICMIVRVISEICRIGIGKAVKTLSVFGVKLLSVVLVCVLLFVLMHGMNYRRTPAGVHMGLTGEGFEYEQYVMTLDWAYMGMIDARRQLGEDYCGVAHMSISFDECVYHANLMLEEVSDYFDLEMSKNYIRAKSVMHSHLWSYTGIAGVYDAVLGESNLNTDYVDVGTFPVTLCHELTHAKGYAREYDAETIAILACIESPLPEFRYAGYRAIFFDLYSEVVRGAQANEAEIYDYFGDSRCAPVVRDLKASQMYYQSLEDNWITRLIDSFSEEVNDAFLKSNGQTGGTLTYQVRPNIYVDFLYTYVLGNEND